MSKKLMEVRDKLSKFLSDPSHLNASTREIAGSFLRTHRATISSDALDEVLITGLVHLMDGVRRRRPRAEGASPIRDLFAGFGVEPIVVVRVEEEDGAVVEKNKGLPSLTLPEAMECLARHTRERVANTKRAREWRRLIARVRPYMTKEGMTLADGMRLADAADAERKRSPRKS